MGSDVPDLGSKQEELRARLGLWRVAGVGPAAFSRLLSEYGTIREAVSAVSAGRGPTWLSGAVRQGFARLDWARADADLQWISENGVTVLAIDEPAYPPMLLQTPAPPPLLFVRGDTALLSEPQLAIVGSRNPTPAGLETARSFAQCLAGSGLCIVSGLALGIDAAGHRGSLDSGGATVAVMATGPDRIYPARNRSLAEEILQRGTLVSEYPPGTSARAGNFPRRNRIIAGLAVGTLVVEATPRSGSLITARLAADQGREVFAIPGSIHNPLARGCHLLIRQGAKLVETANDVLEEIGPLVRGIYQPAESQSRGDAEHGAGPLDPDHVNLLEQMGYDPVTVDQLVARSRLTPAEVSSMLLILELQGRVDALPGGRYVLKG